jgi:transcriptional regulator with XRE-family HTH domain
MDRFNLQEFGNRIKKIRKALRLSQEEFGSPIAVSASSISDIEKGRYRTGTDMIYRISKEYNVNLYYLVYGDGRMFGMDGTLPSLGKKNFGEQIESESELLWYIDHSPLFKHTMMGFATKFLYDNERIIKKDIDIKNSKKEINHE